MSWDALFDVNHDDGSTEIFRVPGCTENTLAIMRDAEASRSRREVNLPVEINGPRDVELRRFRVSSIANVRIAEEANR